MIVDQIGYYGAALALRLFSLNGTSKGLYRAIGNKLLWRKHTTISQTDIEQGLWLHRTIIEHLRRPGRLLELGTGWTHFYSLFLKHLRDDKIVLFDIQDNRHLGATKARMAKSSEILLNILPPGTDHPKERIRNVSKKIGAAKDFETLYTDLDLIYRIESSGDLTSFGENEFDVIFSVDVLEHIPSDQLERNSACMFKMLRPGGLFVHQVGLDDHIAHYAPKMPKKNYLKYSESTWKLLFDNEVQYFNRLQIRDYVEIFKETGFTIQSLSTDVDSRSVPDRIADVYQDYGREDLEAVRAKIIFVK